MLITEDRWLANIFGYDVYRVDIPPSSSQVSREIGEHIDRQSNRAFYYAKLNLSDVDLVRQLSAAGFYVTDVSVTLGTGSNAPAVLQAVHSTSVTDVRPEEHDEIPAIAQRSFLYSRFHLDPLIPKSLADRIKREWIANYIRKGRGDRLFVARSDGRPAGFLAALVIEDGGRRTAVIDLVGVDPQNRRGGIGSALVNSFFTHYRSSCDSLQVGTQAANLPSLRLYEKHGMTIIKMNYVMHMHIGGTNRG